MEQIAKSIDTLRRDAIEREMSDLAIVYGWSQIRLNEEAIGRQMTRIEKYRLVK